MIPYFQDDAVTIYHGDCREIVHALGQFDIVVADPPYGVNYISRHIGPFQGREIAGDGDAGLYDWAVSLAQRGPAAIFGHWRNPPPAARAALIWDKGMGVGMGDLSFPWKPNFEMIWLFGDGWEGHRHSGVLTVNSVSWASRGLRQHPAEKPTELIRLILAKAPAGITLDPFMGSGTTLRAAKDLGRKAIGIEVEERYCEIAANRMAQGVLS